MVIGIGKGIVIVISRTLLRAMAMVQLFPLRT